MNKIKVKLDREKLSSNYIESKQDFKEVTSQVHASEAILKSTWFYGGLGLASLATIVTLSIKTSNASSNENNSTLNSSITAASFVPSRQTKDLVKKAISAGQKFDKKTINQDNEIVSNKKSIPHTTLQKTFVKDETDAKKTEVISTTIVKPTIIQNTEKAKKNFMPKISGVYNGEIQIQQLCESGIEVNEEVEIISFTVNYSTNRGDKALKVNGKRIPSNVCSEMHSFGIDQMIFIMDIVGKNSDGELLRFVPMNLTATIE